jgi:hypothetical protein
MSAIDFNIEKPNDPETQLRNNYNKFFELEEKARFRITDPLQESPVCIEVIQNGYSHKIGTLGNILMIQAKGKAGKTYFTSALTASLLSEKSYINFNGHLPPDKQNVIYFDTEQGHEDARTVQQRIYEMAGLSIDQEAPNFHYYTLRPLIASERLGLIDYIINQNDKIGVVIIDGVRDLINDFNDTGQSFVLIEKLMKWSEERRIHIIAILHQNPNDDKARGHLGTELTNKAEFIISINKDRSDDSYRSVEGYGRRKSFKPFSYTLDEKEFPVLMDGERDTGKIDPLKIDQQIHKNLLKIAYSKINPNYKKSKNVVWQSIKLNYKLTDSRYSFSDSQCKELVEYYIQQGLLINKGTSEKYDLELK